MFTLDNGGILTMMQRLKGFVQLLIEAGKEFAADKAPRLGAALSFYTMISLTPLLVVLVGIFAQFYGTSAARGELVEQIEGTVGREVATLVEGAIIQANATAGSGTFFALIGFFALLVGATTLLYHLKGVMNTIWSVESAPNTRGVIGIAWSFVRDRLIVLLVIMGIGALFFGMLIASAVIEGLAVYFADILPIPAWVLRLVNIGISFLLTVVLFGYLYKTLPDVRINWRSVLVGALVASFLFTIGKYLIGLYLGRSSVASLYGAAGSLVVMLLWVYYSAQIFFYGAEVTRVHEMQHGDGGVPRRGFVFQQDCEDGE